MVKLMKFVRPEQSWKILLAGTGAVVCLEELALRCGYRICEACAELGCSESYFHRIFVRDIGLGPKDWMRRERMVVAQRKLTEGRSPKEVAVYLGFSSQNNFRREFLAVCKVPPGQFQKERSGLDGVSRRAERDPSEVIVKMPVPPSLQVSPEEWGTRRRAQ